MSALAASETAMSALANSATGRTYISGSEYYDEYIKEDTMCIAKMAVGFAGLDSAAYSSMAGVAAESTAMTAVAASSTAMTAVAASTVAKNAITASTTAYNALAASPLCTKWNDTSDGWNNETIRNGKGFVVDHYGGHSTSNTNEAYVTIDGAKTMVNHKGTTKLNKFFDSSLAVYNYYKNSYVRYIPIN